MCTEGAAVSRVCHVPHGVTLGGARPLRVKTSEPPHSRGGSDFRGGTCLDYLEQTILDMPQSIVSGGIGLQSVASTG